MTTSSAIPTAQVPVVATWADIRAFEELSGLYGIGRIALRHGCLQVRDGQENDFNER